MSRLRLRPVVAGVALALAGVLTLSACSTPVVRPYAAVVDGEVISQAALQDELDDLLSNAPFVALLDQQAGAGGGLTLRGETSAPSTQLAATVLSGQITYLVIDNELERLGRNPGDAGPALVAFAEELLGQQYPDPAIVDAFSPEYRQVLVRRNVSLLTLGLALADVPSFDAAGLQRWWETNSSQVCASHILVETQAEAQEILAALAAGGSFAELAAQRSTDTGSGAQGGSLGCADPAQYVDEFRAAVTEGPIGQPFGPVQTQFGFHVILVTERGSAGAFDEAQARQAVLRAADQALGQWFQGALTDASVEVDPRFGTWDAEQGTVVAPTPPTTPTTEPVNELPPAFAGS